MELLSTRPTYYATGNRIESFFKKSGRDGDANEDVSPNASLRKIEFFDILFDSGCGWPFY